MRLPLLAVVIAGCPARRPLAAETPPWPHIVVGIHDYAHLSADRLARAQRFVASVYEAIGVRTIWRETIRPDEPRVALQDRVPEPGELIVILLTSRMPRDW